MGKLFLELDKVLTRKNGLKLVHLMRGEGEGRSINKNLVWTLFDLKRLMYNALVTNQWLISKQSSEIFAWFAF
jgi:hypothetical protein